MFEIVYYLCFLNGYLFSWWCELLPSSVLATLWDHSDIQMTSLCPVQGQVNSYTLPLLELPSSGSVPGVLIKW